MMQQLGWIALVALAPAFGYNLDMIFHADARRATPRHWAALAMVALAAAILAAEAVAGYREGRY